MDAHIYNFGLIESIGIFTKLRTLALSLVSLARTTSQELIKSFIENGSGTGASGSGTGISRGIVGSGTGSVTGSVTGSGTGSVGTVGSGTGSGTGSGACSGACSLGAVGSGTRSLGAVGSGTCSLGTVGSGTASIVTVGSVTGISVLGSDILLESVKNLKLSIHINKSTNARQYERPQSQREPYLQHEQ